jgi:AcrR family transcriptional regulator
VKPLGRRARKVLAVRQALFDAGLAAFERQPIGLVSILDITEAADVAKGVFYLHFKSKDEYLLALWEDVQRRFLEEVGVATLACRSDAARVEAAVRQITGLATASPAYVRFWIRVSSFLPDEIGEPGHLRRINQQYVRQLAALLFDRAAAQLKASDVRAAQVVHSLCWAILSTTASTGEVLCDQTTMGRMVASAVRTVEKAAERA